MGTVVVVLVEVVLHCCEIPHIPAESQQVWKPHQHLDIHHGGEAGGAVIIRSMSSTFRRLRGCGTFRHLGGRGGFFT